MQGRPTLSKCNVHALDAPLTINLASSCAMSNPYLRSLSVLEWKRRRRQNNSPFTSPAYVDSDVDVHGALSGMYVVLIEYHTFLDWAQRI